LEKYLPKDQINRLPALVNNESSSDVSERDILYKVLFDMKKDMVDLKKLVVELLQNGVSQSAVNEHMPYINQLYREVDSNTTPYLGGGSNATLTIHDSQTGNHNPEFAPYVAQEAEEVKESLSLAESESDLIKKALAKHKGKRKSAAKELGISERTLYRKIKDLGLK